MSNIWDLPENIHPVHGRKSGKKVKKTQKKASEQDMVSSTNNVVNTAANFMTAGMGMAVMANMGSAVIGSLAKK